ncbi:hypothetical protein N0V95_005964 [Ascochyta clinopodiicola]|nr:hypothetical protein N0V95_005964 [Ascochyta clinopodiicola]
MIEAASLAQPHLIICPFLTSRVPAEIYNNFLTLIVHPGPPGDAGPSSLDWVLMGDDGSVADENQLLETNAWSQAGRSHWGVTVLQAVEEFDTGPVWAFEQFKININDPEVTKSSIYRGPVTDAVVTATLVALDRITMLAGRSLTVMPVPGPITSSKLLPRAESASEWSSLLSTDQLRVQKTISPKLVPGDSYRSLSITTQQPFQGGPTHRRPLLKAAQRSFNIRNDSAHNISRKIRSADSQPGCLTQIFGGFDLYIYGGIIEDRQHLLWQGATRNQAKDESSSAPEPGIILAQRDGAVCIATSDGKGIWVSHVRRVKRKEDAFLWPKVPATLGLHELGLLEDEFKPNTYCEPLDWSKASHSTYQSVWVDFDSYNDASHVAYVYFEFYNGAMGTAQCTQLLRVLEAALAAHTDEKPLAAVVLMGGKSYFSNGIALNVIEANGDPSGESWRNINRINDVVHMLLEVLPGRGITTIAALRGNCAAGGVAMAAACDFVVAGSGIVLNPAYGALALYGSEYHTLTYPARCGVQVAKQISSKMCPISESS